MMDEDLTPLNRFREDYLITELHQYICNTYDTHYSTDKLQASEVIFDSGHGTGFNMGNIMKYAQRYGKKGTPSDGRKDLMKIAHYALLQLFVHDELHPQWTE